MSQVGGPHLRLAPHHTMQCSSGDEALATCAGYSRRRKLKSISAAKNITYLPSVQPFACRIVLCFT